MNYKDADWKKQLKHATPEYIDVFFDNVGGEVLDACLMRAARNARFVICGAISQYNAAKPRGPSSYMNVIVSSGAVDYCCRGKTDAFCSLNV